MKISAADGTDYLYEKHGKKWRVRVRPHHLIRAEAPSNGDAELERAGMSVIISVALLEENGNVAAAPDGTFRVFPGHVLTFVPESFGKIDPEDVVENTIQDQLDAANDQLSGKDKLYKLLEKFS